MKEPENIKSGSVKTATKKMSIYLNNGETVEISPKEIDALQQRYGKNWMKTVKSIPIDDQRKKRDKKASKASRKSRKQNRKTK